MSDFDKGYDCAYESAREAVMAHSIATPMGIKAIASGVQMFGLTEMNLRAPEDASEEFFAGVKQFVMDLKEVGKEN